MEKDQKKCASGCCCKGECQGKGCRQEETREPDVGLTIYYDDALRGAIIALDDCEGIDDALFRRLVINLVSE